MLNPTNRLHLLYVVELLGQLEQSDPARFEDSVVILTNHLESALARAQQKQPRIIAPFTTKKESSRGRRN